MTVEEVLSQPIVQRLGWTLVHFIWQGTAVAALFGIVMSVLRRRTANSRYVAACTALVLMLVSPLVTMRAIPVPSSSAVIVEPAPVASPSLETPQPMPLVSPSVRPVEYEPVSLPPDVAVVRPPALKTPWHRRASELFEPVLPWLVCGWLVGVMVLSVRLLGGWARVQRLKRRLVEPVADKWHETLAHLSERLRVRQRVRILQSALAQVPTVVGWLRPVILLPASAFTGLTPQQLEALIAHELAHIRRYDYLVNLLQTVVETLLFYHPAVWWVSHRIRVEREHCCDDLAVTACGDRLTYARALAEMEQLRTASLHLAVASTGGSLIERIRRLAGASVSHSNRASWLPAGAVAIAIVLVFGMGVQISSSSHETKEEPARLIADTDTKEAISAWHLLKQTDVGPILSPLVVRMAKAMEPSVRSSSVWAGRLLQSLLTLDIQVEGEDRQEILVGFFKTPDWSDSPSHVRWFPGPGEYTLSDIPPGQYYLGAIMGLAAVPWGPAGQYRDGAMVGSYPEYSGLGVDESWPRPIVVSSDVTTHVRILVSSENKWAGWAWLLRGVIMGWYGNWKKMDPGRLITVRTVDSKGNPIPFCRITFFDRSPKTSYSYLESGTDEQGYAYCDQIRGPFTVMAQRFDFVPETLADRSQYKRIGEEYNVEDKPVITIRWDPFPEGPGRLVGKVRDQHGRPLKEYYLTVRHEEGERLGDDDYYTTRYHLPVVDPEGRFDVGRLAPGTYRLKVRHFDYSAYVHHEAATPEVTVPKEEPATVEIEVEAKELLYGRAVYSDGTAVYPGGWTARFDQGPSRRHFSLGTEPDGSFRVCLSAKEREELLANSSGMVEIKDQSGKLREVHIDELSRDSANPSMITYSLPEGVPGAQISADAPQPAGEPPEEVSESLKPRRRAAQSPEVVEVRLVDTSGEPVAGARVSTQVDRRPGREPEWWFGYGGDPGAVSSPSGRAVLRNMTYAKTVFAWHRSRGLVGVGLVGDAEQAGSMLTLTMYPACRVYGNVRPGFAHVGPSADSVWVELTWHACRILDYSGAQQGFEFFVPPGRYRLRAVCQDTEDVSTMIEVKPGERALAVDLGELPPTFIGRLFGKPAPDLHQIKEWFNGGPLTLADLRGKYVLLHFGGGDPLYATALHDAFSGSDLVIIVVVASRPTRLRDQHGRDLPFIVALDGGGKTRIGDSDKFADGATAAAYGIGLYDARPLTFLIGPDGTLLGRFAVEDRLNAATAELERLLGVSAATPPWRKRLEEVYYLDEGEAIKHIPPPFIPERQIMIDYSLLYTKGPGPSDSLLPEMMQDMYAVCGWDGHLIWPPYAYGGLSWCYPGTLMRRLRLDPVEWDGPMDVLRTRLLPPGDWIVREGLTLEQRIAALESVLGEVFNTPVHIEQRQVEREVVVARGRFKHIPLTPTHEHNTLYLYSDPDAGEDSLGGLREGTLASFLDRGIRIAARLMPLPIVDETESSDMHIQWRYQTSWRTLSLGEVDRFLESISKQSSLQFERERRPATVWFVTSGEENRGAAAGSESSRAPSAAGSEASLAQSGIAQPFSRTGTTPSEAAAAMRDAKRKAASVARRFLEAIRDGDIETMLTLVVEYPPEWTVARWQEVAEKVRQEYESQPVRLVNLRETAVDPPRYAAVRIYGPSEEKDEYRFLLLMNCISSGWRVSLMDSSPTDVPLQQHLDSIKKLLTFKNLLEDKGEERKRIVFRGLDLTDAPRRRYRDKPVELRSGGVIRTTEGGPLARRDRLVVEVFYVPGKNVFYLRYCSLYTLDSTLYYGPFEGDPFKRLHIARPKSAMQPAQDRTAD